MKIALKNALNHSWWYSKQLVLPRHG